MTTAHTYRNSLFLRAALGLTLTLTSSAGCLTDAEFEDELAGQLDGLEGSSAQVRGLNDAQLAEFVTQTERAQGAAPSTPDELAVEEGAARYVEDDCPDRRRGEEVIVVAGVRICPDEQVLNAAYPSYPEHSYHGSIGFDPETFDEHMLDALGDDVMGLSWIVVDTAAEDDKVLTAGGGGFAWHPLDSLLTNPDVDLWTQGRPMTPETFAIVGSVSKFISSVLFIRMLEELEADPERNPDGLTVPQLLELPAWHFLPRPWKRCIGDATCGVTLSAGEDEETANESFKNVRIRDLINHTSGLGKAGTPEPGSTEVMWHYLVTGQEKYNLDGDDNDNALQGTYDYENVNVLFLAPLTLGLARPDTRHALGHVFDYYLPYQGDSEMLEAWSSYARPLMLSSMHEVFVELLDLTGSAFRYSCDVPAWVDIKGDPISEVALVYGDDIESVYLGGQWLSSVEYSNGCPPQGSFWSSPRAMAELVYELNNGFFNDDRVLPMILAYGDPSARMIFDNPIKSPYIDANFDYNGGDIPFKGGDQPTSSAWTFASTGAKATDFKGRSGHAAVIYLPFDHVAFAVTNSGELNGRKIARELKNAWVWAVQAGTSGLPTP